MKKQYFVTIVLLCLLFVNIIEYKYNGPAEASFGAKWTAVMNASSSSIDNSFESALTNIRNNNETSGSSSKAISSSNAFVGYASNGSSLIFGNQRSSTDVMASSSGNVEYAISGSANNGNGGGAFLASNGIGTGKGPSIGIVGDIAMPQAFGTSSSNVFSSGGDVGTLDGPGGPGSGDGGDPFGGGLPSDTPIDGGLSVLLAAAVGRGIQSLRKKKKIVGKLV